MTQALGYPAANAVLAIVALSLVYLAYRWALPRPLPGIPFDESARRSLFGSLPEIQAHIRKTGRLRTWIAAHPTRHNSALTQIWMGPLSKPALVLADFQESQDILLRRNKEFDRAQRSADIFAGPIGNHHIGMTSSDPRFKGNKELVRDLMTPNFLHEVSAPQIYAKTMTLIDLWTLKAGVAQGRPFNARRDIFDAAIDIINAVTFGLDDDLSTVKKQLDTLMSIQNLEAAPVAADGSIKFPELPEMPDIAAINAVGDHVGDLFKSIYPIMYHRYKVLTNRKLAENIARKDRLIHAEIDKAVVRLRDGDSETRSAMDHILQREINAAAKSGREPVFHSPRIHDELFGYIVGGHDTSSTALAWMVKNIANHQEVQTKLRTALRSAYAAAHAEGRQPSVVELWKTPVPYLDAVLEESLRVDGPVPINLRESKVDTYLLGHEIPKGTSVFIVGNGPGFQSPSLPVPDSVRSETSRAKHSYGSWDPADMHLFKPERWMKTGEDGKEVYDAHAGPMLAFSLGPRGCFGRRLAYLETRIVLAMLVWNFEFHQLSDELSSHAAYDKITTNPKYCYVGLSKAK
ncbi:Uu.00g146880.m01.CDS01 [Anthostomella pinea]|uniref:Uu.00g146880.m01.CDS01 n=1 Tax=Anthostomella pinea TaxID=933095 RepID=A0AAI8YLZ1_9PEZI|nr:Uu.00g146880.m01.CDS01 [Anthostomella pinea]